MRQTQDKGCGYNDLKACARLVCESAWVRQGQSLGQSQGAPLAMVSVVVLWVMRSPLALGLGSDGAQVSVTKMWGL